MITRDEGQGGTDAALGTEVGGVCSSAAVASDDRARTNLALLYGGTGRAPMPRVVIEPPDRLRAAATAGG